MDNALKILFVEDDPADAELAVSDLKKGGLACVTRRVETGVELTRELEAFAPDIVLCDFTLPGFDGLSALKIVQETSSDTPLIFVSGTMGEETAIEALKRGATDYVFKSNLKRLAPAVRRALKEADDYTARKRAEENRVELTARLQKYQEQLSGILTTVPGVVWEQYGQPDTATHSVNFASEYITRLTGYSMDDWLTTPDFWLVIMHPEDREDAARTAAGNFTNGKGGNQQFRWITKEGRTLWVESTYSVIADAMGAPIGLRGVTIDISERKHAEQVSRESEVKYRQLVEQAADGIFLIDAQGPFVFVNARGCELLGYAEHEIVGMNAKATYLDEEREIHTERLKQLRAGQFLHFERTVKRKDGSVFPAEISVKMLETGLIQAIFHDVTMRRDHEQKIARLNRIHSVLSAINSAIVRIRERNALCEEACRIAVELGQFSVGWIARLDQSTGKLVPVAQAGMPLDFMAGRDSSGLPLGFTPAETAQVAIREQRPAFDNDIESNPGPINGNNGPDTLSIRRTVIGIGAKSVIVLPLIVEGEIFGVLTLYASERNFFDEAELRLLNELAADVSFSLEFIANEEKVAYLAYYDALTGLPNRALFSERLSQNLAIQAESPDLVAAVLMDLERFHLVNDTLNRQAGDEVLRLIARRLESNAARTRFSNPARLAADGFGVILRGVRDAGELAHLLESGMKACFGEPFVVDGHELRLAARAGVSVYPSDGTTAEEILQNAELALKKSKETKERFVFYAPGMTARVAGFLALETRLRKAIELEQFVLHYQPKFDMVTGKITGIEALIRWNDPDMGLMPPVRFIPILEETGMIFEVGRWALRQAVKDQRRWCAAGLPTLRIAVNVSAQQLRDPDFVRDVQRALESDNGLKPSLELEITESLLMDDIERNIERLKTLRYLGVSIAIDDFGTGYSSLNYLARLPMDTLKIDRSFVAGMTESPESKTIVLTIISLAHSLGLKVVAEGVETAEQSNLLAGFKCDQAQGFLFSRPIAFDEMAGFLLKSKYP